MMQNEGAKCVIKAVISESELHRVGPDRDKFTARFDVAYRPRSLSVKLHAGKKSFFAI